MGKYYFFMGDVLGFSNIVSNLADVELESRIKNIANLVKEAAEEAGISSQSFQLMSDTIFAYSISSVTGLESLIKFSRLLLNKGIERSVPIRGAISFGELVWNENDSPTIYGKAVIDAHSLEKKQEWMGVICSLNLPHLQTLTDHIVFYPPPMKTGKIQIYGVVRWDVPTSEQLLKYLCLDGLTKEGEHLTWEHFGYKIQNTILFGCYLKLLSAKKITALNSFYGYLPIQVLENEILDTPKK